MPRTANITGGDVLGEASLWAAEAYADGAFNITNGDEDFIARVAENSSFLEIDDVARRYGGSAFVERHRRGRCTRSRREAVALTADPALLIVIQLLDGFSGATIG